MIWDPIQRRYEDERGRPVSPAAIRKVIDDYIETERKLVKVEALKVIDSSIITAEEFRALVRAEEFFAFMRDKVSAWHAISGVVAYGGEPQMNAERWARINQKVSSELEYLANFERETRTSLRAVQAIANKIASEYPDAQAALRQSLSRALLTVAPGEAEAVAKRAVIEVVGRDVPVSIGSQAADLIGGQIINRSEMYPDAAWSTLENNVMAREFDEGVRLGRRVCAEDERSCDECVAAAGEGFVPLDQLDEIGSLQCMNNCRCEFEFDVEGAQFATSDLFTGIVGGQDRYGGSVELQ
jgi:hypothetical protein